MKIKISKRLCSLLCALLLCAIPMTAFASELDKALPSGNAVITAQVPSSHTLTVNTDGAEIFVNSIAANDSQALERQSTPTLLIRADSNKKLKTVMLNGTDITAELINGMITLPPVITDQTLTVTTAEETIPSAVTYTVTGTVKQDGKPVSDITLELHSKSKTTVTGNDGTFAFKKVESGHHSLTALKDGNAVGYAEFTLTGGSAVLDFAIAGNGTVDISVPDNTAVINLDLSLSEDGVLRVADVKVTDYVKPGDGFVPRTGDSGSLWLWLALLTLSCAALTTLAVTKKLKKTAE